MTDHTEAKQTAELLAIHIIGALLVTIFFRWQGSNDSYFRAGDESLMANGFNALIDVVYWLFKPRILRWRGE